MKDREKYLQTTTMSTTVITIEQYNEMSGLYCVMSYVDTKQLRKNFKKACLKKKIIGVYVWTYDSPNFKNIANKDVPYKFEVYCKWTDDGCFQGPFGIPCCRHPLGDVFIVVK